MVCQIARERVKHVGEALVIRGELFTDWERATITPTGCAQAFSVGSLEEGIDKQIFATYGFHRILRIQGTFTVELYQGPPNELQFYHDDGVRLHVTSLINGKLVEP
jgi:hypothetical protein